MFRPSVRSLLLCITALAIPMFLLLVLLSEGSHPQWFPLIIGMMAVPLLSAPLAWALHFLFPVRISDEGIVGHSFWGSRRFIRWEHIVEARPFGMLNLRYLRLYSSTDREVTWLALFPADSDAFRRTVHSSMPPGNPVSAYISNA